MVAKPWAPTISVASDVTLHQAALHGAETVVPADVAAPGGRASRTGAVRNEAGTRCQGLGVVIEIEDHLKGARRMQQLFQRLGDIDHVIWDWNGTLLNDVTHAIDTINFLLEPRGLPLMSIERYREIFGFPIRRYYE